jgi:hypothetical protein
MTAIPPEEIIINVEIGNGVVVPHTLAEWNRLMAGVDREAAEKATAPLELEDWPDTC